MVSVYRAHSYSCTRNRNESETRYGYFQEEVLLLQKGIFQSKIKVQLGFAHLESVRTPLTFVRSCATNVTRYLIHRMWIGVQYHVHNLFGQCDEHFRDLGEVAFPSLIVFI